MKETWKQVGEHAEGSNLQHPGSWYEIRAEFDGILTDEQVYQAAGCIGYALRQVFHGEELSEPVKISRKRAGRTVVKFGYDSTKARSDDPDEALAFELAAQYVQTGSPIRTTNRAGAGTAGTRLAEGIGAISTRFWVR